MKKYVITSDVFAGEIGISYSAAGELQGFDLASASLSEKQQVWLLRNMPRTPAELHNLVKNAPSLRLEQVPERAVPFEDFWKRYDDCKVSSKKRALVAWNKMSEAEQSKAYRYVGTYFRSLPQGTRKKYAETYLHSELWNN